MATPDFDPTTLATHKSFDSSDSTRVCARGGKGSIPFYIADFEMLYQTPWTITHHKHARAALEQAGFTLGMPSGVNCGFQFQFDVGGGVYYNGNLNGREVAPGTTKPWNATALDVARDAIAKHPATLEKWIVALPFIVLFVVLPMFFCCVVPCLRSWAKRRNERRRAREAKKQWELREAARVVSPVASSNATVAEAWDEKYGAQSV